MNRSAKNTRAIHTVDGTPVGTTGVADLRAVRQPVEGVAIIDIHGQITGLAANDVMDNYTQATRRGARSVLLNFADLDDMNSSGIGLFVTLLVRAKRQGQRLAAFGLSDHHRAILQVARLDEAINVYDDETHAVGAS